MKIQNVHVDNVSHDFKRAAAGWTDGKARYHFWFSIETREIEGRFSLRSNAPTIFKNSLELDHRKAGFFNTRQLDATVAKNAAIIGEVWTQITQQNLIDRAIAARAAQDAAEVATAKESQRQARIRDAGPRALDLLVKLYGQVESGMLVNNQQLCQERRDEIAGICGKVRKLLDEVAS